MTRAPSPNPQAIREKQRCLVRPPAPATDADCQSAAQQIDNLRYAVADATVTDEAVSAAGHWVVWFLIRTA